MHKAVLSIFIGLSVALILFSLPAVPSGHLINSGHYTNDISTPVSSHVQIYSTYPGSPQYEIYVPLNSSGFAVYPIWHIFLYGNGAFTLSVNGTQVESGYSSGVYNLSYTFSGQSADAVLIFNGKYTFHDSISSELTDHNIQSVQVYSSYPGQAQFLTVQNGVSGALMYTYWTAILQSTQNVTYSIYVGGQSLASGSFVGTKTIKFNVTGSSATVTIGVGKEVYRYPSELISSVPIQKYYAPKPPALVYTVTEYEYGIARAFVASLFAVLVLLLSVRKLVMERNKREVHIL